MTRRRKLVGIAAVLAVALMLVWVVPTLAGTVDCRPYDPAACDQAIEEARAQIGLPLALLPVTEVRLLGSPQCLSYYVEFGWGAFAAIAQSLC